MNYKSLPVEKPLYKTQTENSFEEFRKFNRFLIQPRFRINVIFFSIIFAWFIGYSLYTNHNNIVIVLITTLLIFYIFFFYIFPKQFDNTLQKKWDTMGLSKEEFFYLSFYEKYFEVAVNNKLFSYKYSSIRKIFRTRQNYYLMMSKNQAVIVIQKNCTSELIYFLEDIKRQYSL